MKARQKQGRLLVVAVTLLAIVLTACATQANRNEMVTEVERVVPAEAPGASYGAKDDDGSYSQDIVYQEVEVQERLIIRNADLSVVVSDTEESIAAIEAMVDSSGGWVVNSNIWDSNGIKRGSVTVRVPADTLDAFLADIHELALEVTNQNVSGQDVTEEYIDLQAQLTNLEATADRVRNFLDEAKNVEEALAVNVELSRLEGEIERISGRVQYLENSARYSSVSISITPDALTQPVTVGRWQPLGTARDAVQALLKALQWLVDALIVVVLFVLPIVLIIAAPVVIIVIVVRRRRARRQATE